MFRASFTAGQVCFYVAELRLSVQSREVDRHLSGHCGKCFPGVLRPLRTPPRAVEIPVPTILRLSHLLLDSNGELVIGYFAVNLISSSGGAPPGRAFFWM